VFAWYELATRNGEAQYNFVFDLKIFCRNLFSIQQAFGDEAASRSILHTHTVGKRFKDGRESSGDDQRNKGKAFDSCSRRKRCERACVAAHRQPLRSLRIITRKTRASNPTRVPRSAGSRTFLRDKTLQLARATLVTRYYANEIRITVPSHPPCSPDSALRQTIFYFRNSS